MRVREFTVKDDVPFIICPAGLIPEFQLYDTEEDGTKRYIVNLVPWSAQEDERA